MVLLIWQGLLQCTRLLGAGEQKDMALARASAVVFLLCRTQFVRASGTAIADAARQHRL
jgi:hypothetical protein